MRINRLSITNFKGLKSVEMNEVPDLVILAGPNGSGKSSILEAIAYAKEAVASYSPTRPMINRINDRELISSNSDKARIEVDFVLSAKEKVKLKSLNFQFNDTETIVVTIENTVYGDRKNHSISHLESKISSGFRFLLKNHRETPGLGLMDHIDAHRIFNRQTISSFNFTINSENEKQKRFSPSSEKFNQLKNNLLRLYTLDSFELREDFKMGKLSRNEKYLRNDKKIEKAFELLASKKFKGINIKSNPFKFNVSTPLGEIDIDELSSGEKEIIFVLTELLSLDLNDSIILFDEPDLHLNESVQFKFIEFIKGLGKDNQIWLTSHSSSIINTAESDSLHRVELYNPQKNNNQVVKIIDNDSRVGLLYDVLGTKSILTLGEKIVFIEGIPDNDKFIFETWFDNLKNNIAFVSSGSVNNIHKITEKTLLLLDEYTRFNFFYCIRDGDFENNWQNEKLHDHKQRLFRLNRYHIENYLLDEELIFEIIKVSNKNPFKTVVEVHIAIKESIKKNRKNFIMKILENKINSMIHMNKFSVKGDYRNMNESDIIQQISQYEQDIKLLSQTSINSESIITEVEQFFDTIINDSSDKWKILLPGRDVLKFFIQDYLQSIMKYEFLRDNLVDKIKTKGIPSEIKSIMDTILND